MFYRVLADLTVLLHFGYVLFVIVGLLLIMIGWVARWRWIRNPWFRGLHLSMIVIVVVEAWFGVTCPLTTLEHRLREAGGQSSYQGDFIANWVHEAMFFTAPPWVFTLAYTAFGGLVLFTFLIIPPVRKG
ncbi:MAG: DUF2784 domain-containing protein [Pirellulaceae bacterium]